MMVEPYNDYRYSNITILNNPSLLKALNDTQNEGVLMCIHGWNHEDFTSISPTEAKEAVENSLFVFSEAGLEPAAFIVPYGSYNLLLQSVKSAIESTGIAVNLPVQPQSKYSYGWGWRDMKSFDDNRYENTRLRLINEQPDYIVLHVQDWNIYLKKLIEEYLQETQHANVTIRVDDVEVNTPAEIVYDMTSLLEHHSLEILAFAVVPSGTWRGGDPMIFGISVDAILRLYWLFFLLTIFLPLSYLLIWRLFSRRAGNNENEENTNSRDFEKKKKKNVSVIVTAYNEEENIEKCIESIQNQDYDGDVEIVIVNDGSTDKTADIIANYPVKLINLENNHGKAQALNMGVNNAKGDILVFSDSDSQMAKNAIRLLVEYLEEHKEVGAVAGNVFINEKHANSLAYFQMIEYRIEQEINKHLQSQNGNVLVCPGPLFAVRRHIAEKTIFSDVTVVEDADFTITAIRKRDAKVSWVPEAKVYTEAPKSILSWLNQRKRWWYGNLQLWRAHNGWAMTNPWMLMNYVSFITSTVSIILLLLLPVLFSTYDNAWLLLQRGMVYTIAPIILFFILLSPLFIKQKSVMLLWLLPYILVYSIMKSIVVSYIYLCYLSGRGVKILFGSRIIEAK